MSAPSAQPSTAQRLADRAYDPARHEAALAARRAPTNTAGPAKPAAPAAADPVSPRVTSLGVAF